MTVLILLPLLPLVFLLLTPISAVDLLFNSFSPSDLALYGNASVLPSSSTHRHLSLTNASAFSVGRALLPTRVALAGANSTAVSPFYTSFIFALSAVPSAQPGHGFAFLFSPLPGILGATAAQHLGLFNRSTDGDRSNGVLAVEFDVFENQEFHDIDGNHVGVDVFSLTSAAAHTAGYFPDDKSFVNLTLNSGHNYQAWIDYVDSTLNVTLAPAGVRKPRRPLISTRVNLSFFRPDMYVGFCAATGKMVENHRILAWSFSTSNLSLSDALVTSGLPDFTPAGSSRRRAPAAAIAAAVSCIAAVSAGVGLWLLRRSRDRRRRGGEEEEPAESWEKEYWPHRIQYAEIDAATGGFTERNLVGAGGNGRVYRGVLAGEAVAVKRFHSGGKETDARGFLAEVTSLGRLQHRNLVGLRGWSKRGGDLILVYEYMENGSLEGWLSGGPGALDWGSRVRILRDVAEGVLYLHEGWERKVVHRDIKASNVLLDAGMAARLGDFGQARVHGAAKLGTTRVVGTAGYMAPEVLRSGRAGAGADVYAFGVLALEVASGRRGFEGVVEWAREMAGRGEEAGVVERGVEGFVEEEGRRVVRLAVWCACEEEARRPAMREVVRLLQGGPAEEALESAVPSSPADLECCYRSALGLARDQRHPSWAGMGLSGSGDMAFDSEVLVVGR